MSNAYHSRVIADRSIEAWLGDRARLLGLAVQPLAMLGWVALWGWISPDSLTETLYRAMSAAALTLGALSSATLLSAQRDFFVSEQRAGLSARVYLAGVLRAAALMMCVSEVCHVVLARALVPGLSETLPVGWALCVALGWGGAGLGVGLLVAALVWREPWVMLGVVVCGLAQTWWGAGPLGASLMRALGEPSQDALWGAPLMMGTVGGASIMAATAWLRMKNA